MAADVASGDIVTLTSLVTSVIPGLTLRVEHTLVHTGAWGWGSGGVRVWGGYSVGGHRGVSWQWCWGHDGLWCWDTVGEWCGVHKVTVRFLATWIGSVL